MDADDCAEMAGACPRADDLVAHEYLLARNKDFLPPHAPSRWENVLSGEVVEVASDRKGSTLRAAEVLGNFPVACLHALSG